MIDYIFTDTDFLFYFYFYGSSTTMAESGLINPFTADILTRHDRKRTGEIHFINKWLSSYNCSSEPACTVPGLRWWEQCIGK